MSRLDPWRNGLDAPKGEDADRILQANFDEQAKFNDKIGLYLLGGVKNTASQTVSSTSYVALTGNKLSCGLNGGLVAFVALITWTQSTANLCSIKLTVNGEEKRVIGVGGGGVAGCAPLIWIGTLAAGQTVFALEAKVSGNSTVFQQDAATTIQVLEFAKG